VYQHLVTSVTACHGGDVLVITAALLAFDTQRCRHVFLMFLHATQLGNIDIQGSAENAIVDRQAEMIRADFRRSAPYTYYVAYFFCTRVITKLALYTRLTVTVHAHCTVWETEKAG